MNLFLFATITAMLLNKTKAADVAEVGAKLRRQNFLGRVSSIGKALMQHGATLEAAYQTKKDGWFGEDSPEQIEDWLNEIIVDIQINGIGGISHEVFDADIEAFGTLAADCHYDGCDCHYPD